MIRANLLDARGERARAVAIYREIEDLEKPRRVERLAEKAEPELRFEPESIEWRSYWLDVHMPGLRRWCFPIYENKDRELYVPAVPFTLLELPEESADEHKEAG